MRDVKESADVVGFYFGAHWAPESVAFTPKLDNVYIRLRTPESDVPRFQIVYVPYDRNLHEFEDHLSMMPWLSLKFGDMKAVARLGTRFCVRGVPVLAMVDVRTGLLINRDARGDVTTDPRGEYTTLRDHCACAIGCGGQF